MLEDDEDRLTRFCSLLAEHWPQVEFRHWRSAHTFIEAYPGLPQSPAWIGLDHDLFVQDASEPDPGDGRFAARFLATQRPCCPILIHSTNSFAADSMLFSLQDAGWNFERISPIGEDWIEAYWLPTLKRMMSFS